MDTLTGMDGWEFYRSVLGPRLSSERSKRTSISSYPRAEWKRERFYEPLDKTSEVGSAGSRSARQSRIPVEDGSLLETRLSHPQEAEAASKGMSHLTFMEVVYKREGGGRVRTRVRYCCKLCLGSYGCRIDKWLAKASTAVCPKCSVGSHA